MKQNLKKFFHRLGKAIGTAAFSIGLKSFLLWLLASFSGIIALNWISEAAPWIKEHLVSLILVTIILISYISVYIWQKYSIYIPKFPPVETDYRILEKIIVMEFKTPTKAVYRKKYKIKALRNGLNKFSDSYRWTGDPREVITCTNPIHILVITHTRSGRQCYDVYFDVTLSKGDDIEFEVVWNLQNTLKRMQPFISSPIHEPIEKLIFQIIFSRNCGVTQITEENRPDVASSIAFHSATHKLKELNHNSLCHIWEISRPKLMQHYEIKWVSPNSTIEGPIITNQSNN